MCFMPQNIAFLGEYLVYTQKNAHSLLGGLFHKC